MEEKNNKVLAHLYVRLPQIVTSDVFSGAFFFFLSGFIYNHSIFFSIGVFNFCLKKCTCLGEKKKENKNKQE